MVKCCTKCGVTKSIDEFFKLKKSLDGHRTVCKECTGKQVSAWQLANHDKVLGYYKNFHKKYKEKEKESRRRRETTDLGRAKKNTYQRAYYHAHKEKFKVSRDKYRAEHREELLAKKRQYGADHREERALVNRIWREANREVNLAKKRAYGKTHPEVGFRHTQKRRAQKRTTQIEVFTRQQWEFLKSLCGYRCAYCRKKTVALQQDHVIPLARGGTHTLDNIVPACGPCNQKKGVKPVSLVQLALPDLIRGLGA